MSAVSRKFKLSIAGLAVEICSGRSAGILWVLRHRFIPAAALPVMPGRCRKADVTMRTMRSKNIQLFLLATTAIAITGCDNSSNEQKAQEQAKGETVNEDLTFVGPGKCASVGLNPDGTGVRTYTDEYCRNVEREARESFDNTAPLYATRDKCVAEHGEEACPNDVRTVNRDGETKSGYMPAFAGFMVGTAAALAAAHIFHTMSGNARSTPPRSVPVYTSLSQTCRTNPRDPSCQRGSTGGGGGGARGGYTYGYNGYTVAEPSASSPNRATATVTRTSTGSFAPATSARAGFGGSTASGVSASARGGFGVSAGAHAGGGGS